MKKLMVIVVVASVLFLVFLWLARSVIPGGTIASFNNLGNFSNISSKPIDTSKNNSLLSFLSTPGSSGGDSRSYSQNSADSSSVPVEGRSPRAGAISIGFGNAIYNTQPFEEYVTIRNSGQGPIDITGWTLTNSKGTRPIQNSSNDYLYPANESATIGQGTEFLDPSGRFIVGPILLRPGDNAIVTTGQPFVQFPFSISTSFRENICDGYLKNYPFEPALNRTCPSAVNDPDIRTVTDECYDYMRSLNRCEDPFRDDKTNFDLQTSQCRNFMTARLSYQACVLNYGDDSNFSTKQWRIFLGQKRELWANRREVITLYDSQGLIVDRISY